MLTSLKKFDKMMFCRNTEAFSSPQLLLLKSERVWRSETFLWRQKSPPCCFSHAVLTCFHQLHRVTSSALKPHHSLAVCSLPATNRKISPCETGAFLKQFSTFMQGFVSSGFIFFVCCFLPSALQLSFLRAPTSKFSTNRPLCCTAEVTKIIHSVPGFIMMK